MRNAVITIRSFAAPMLDLADCLRIWDLVVATAPPGEGRDFAEKIDQMRQRPDWEPGPQTLDLMRRLAKWTADRLDLGEAAE
ncbi:hypothetical protein [Frigidibacter oleivorans]|uniref:hypothetical protein n=1 Tax=Frigidibacter oleivorans TaxID=2487129 RepID=UPI000F8F68E4|nr:hypothetical protein [Frigidibacter oleivorans]